MATLESNIELKKKANKVVRFRTLFATGAGLIPVPWVDAAGILAVQLWMLRDLAKVYGIPFKKHIAKSLIGTLVGDLGAMGMVKLIPGVGTLPGMATTAISGAAATYALGKLFHQHFSQGGTLLSFDPVKSQEYFRQLYEEGKASVKELQAQEAGFQDVQAQALASTAALKKANDELRATILALQGQLAQSKQDRKFAVAALQEKKERKRFRLLLPLILLLVAAGGIWAYRSGYFRSQKAEQTAAEIPEEAGKTADKTAGKTAKASPPAATNTASPEKTDTSLAAQNPAKADSSISASAKEAQAQAPDADALGFAAGTSEAQIADYLSKPNARFPKTFPLSALQFEEGATELSPQAREQVANLAKLLQSYPEVKVKLYGQTDQNAGLAVNRQAGLNRAKAIENALKQAGVPGRRIETAYKEQKAEPSAKRGAEMELAKMN